ncbi:MAG TPA: isoprenyl transferase [Clostridia bacterium]|nr:isoprenyl transferase [Clostridia bacterium]
MQQDKSKEDMLLAALDKRCLPQHVAIIMDGNGRWAQKRNMERVNGHREGVKSLKEVVKLCAELELPILTVYAFSTENWKRPQREVDILMGLLLEYINRDLDEIHKNNIRINPIGKIDEMPSIVKNAIQQAIILTENNTGLLLNVALNYGGRSEINEAVKKIAGLVKDGKLCVEDIDEELIDTHLYTGGLPDVDLLIRPSGEYRVSNFLLWQIAYAEFWLTPVLWPDFGRQELLRALVEYQARERRFGGIIEGNLAGEKGC